MYRYFLAFLFLLSISVFSCEQEASNSAFNPTTTETKVLNFQDYDDFSYLPSDSFFMDVSFVPLEGVPGSFISSIRKIEASENKIFVLDGREHNIKVFDFQGNFSSIIENKGDFPGGYNRLYDFYLKEGKVNLLSGDGNLIEHSIENAAFNKIGSARPEVSSSHAFLQTDQATFVCSYFDAYQMYVFDKSLDQLVKQTLPNPNIGRKLQFGPIRPPFYQNKSGSYFVTPHSYSVYQISEKSSPFEKAKYEFNFGARNFDFEQVPESFSRNINEQYVYLRDNKIAIPILGFHEDENYIGVHFQEGGRRGKTIVVSKKSEKPYLLKLPKGIESNFYPFFSDFNDFNVGVFLPPVSNASDELRKFLSLSQKNEEEIDKLLKMLTEENNPIMMMYKVKE